MSKDAIAAGFALYAVVEVTDYKLDQNLGDFKAEVAKQRTSTSPGDIRVLYHGHHLTADDHTLKSLKVEKGKKLVCTNMGAVAKADVGKAVRAMGVCFKETSLDGWLEDCKETGADMKKIMAWVTEAAADPITKDDVEEMFSVLDKKGTGGISKATCMKIMKTLEPEKGVTEDMLNEMMKQAMAFDNGGDKVMRSFWEKDAK